jgi:DNA (cytosine-5)-methyltransferase 1
MNSEFSRLYIESGYSMDELSKKVGFSKRTLYRWAKGEKPPRQIVMEFLNEEILKGVERKKKNQSKFTFIDLFAGIGGMRLGFEAAGGHCVYTSEWNKFARETYAANFPKDVHEIAGDITEISEKDIPEHDVLVAGFPCQPFSLAGVSKKNSLNQPHGFRCDTQGTLFFDVARIIDHHQPKAFLLENVKNLVSHDGGKTFKVILKTLKDELGYHIDYRVIDASHWVPQHRERIFIVGFREKNDFSLANIKFPKKKRVLADILHGQEGEKPELPYTEEKTAKAAAKYTLSDHLWNYLQAHAAKHRARGNGFGFGLVGPDDISRTLSARYHKDGSEILIRQPRKNPRRLTPRECSRLMGFTRGNKNSYKIPVSDTQAYRQFGNAVVVPVVASVAKLMLPYVEEALERGSFAERARVANG